MSRSRLIPAATTVIASATTSTFLLLLVVVIGAGTATAHSYLSTPPARTGTCVLNGIVMGDTICREVVALWPSPEEYYRGDDNNTTNRSSNKAWPNPHAFLAEYDKNYLPRAKEQKQKERKDGGGRDSTYDNDSSSSDDEMQCLSSPTFYSHLFHVHPTYAHTACGGSPHVHGTSGGGSQGLLQNCNDVTTDPIAFNMSLPGPEDVNRANGMDNSTTTFRAGSEVDLGLDGFFHEGVMRIALCYFDFDDSSSSPSASGGGVVVDCSSPAHFETYVLGYHFTEGTSGPDDDIYRVRLGLTVRMPRRTGRAVLQWLHHAEDVRSYVSCTTVEIVDGETTITGNEGGEDGGGGVEEEEEGWYCNGHPLCNCTTHSVPTYGTVGLGGTCPRGTAPSLYNGQRTGTDIVDQYKVQLGVDAFCRLCITDGCPSTCGGRYEGFYQGPHCTNDPVVGGCNGTHLSGLPRYVECTGTTCTAPSGWTPLPTPPPTPLPSTASPPPTPPDVISEDELNTEFIRSKLRYKKCRYIGQLESQSKRTTICTKKASARNVCQASCSPQGCVPSFQDDAACQAESLLEYRHSRKKMKTCGWLRDAKKRANICRRVRDASDKCPTVCMQR